MEEFNGPKALIDEQGNSLATQQYVEWLEHQVATLRQQLAASRAKDRHPIPRRLYDQNDYVPYPDEGDDRDY